MQDSNNLNFNHLKVHTQYSICEGAIKIDDLKNYCKENRISSLGLSDTSNLCGALEFAENISKSGTQPIIGTQINFKFEDTLGLLPFADFLSSSKKFNNYKCLCGSGKLLRFCCAKTSDKDIKLLKKSGTELLMKNF